MTDKLELLEKLPEELPEKSGGEEKKPITVCFVCTGNVCRSPMAAAVLNHLGKGEYRAISAGVAACDGDRISENARLALKDAGIESTADNDYEGHRAKNLDERTVAECDRIVAISSRHMLSVLYAFPEAAPKLCAMPRDIPDPFMMGIDVYKACLAEITAGIREAFEL